MPRSKRKITHRRSRRNKRSENNFAKGTKLFSIFAIPVLVVGIGGYLMTKQMGIEKFDSAFCYERNNQHQTASLSDFSLTHQLSTKQLRDFKNAMVKAYRKMPVNGRLSVFTTSQESDSDIAEPVFTICKPASTEAEQARLKAPYKTPMMLKRQSQEALDSFNGFIDKLVNDGKNLKKVARNSPILESIRAVSFYDFKTPLRSLILFSDGVNNSRSGQFCMKKGHMPQFKNFEKKRGYESYIKPNSFMGVDVMFLLVESTELPSPQLKFCTSDELRDWWSDYLKGNGAENPRLIPLRWGVSES